MEHLPVEAVRRVFICIYKEQLEKQRETILLVYTREVEE